MKNFKRFVTTQCSWSTSTFTCLEYFILYLPSLSMRKSHIIFISYAIRRVWPSSTDVSVEPEMQKKKNFIVHDDVIKWKHFSRYWPFLRGIHRSPVNSRHKGRWRGALMFSLICAWINVWMNNHETGDLRRLRAHYDVSVMYTHVALSLLCGWMVMFAMHRIALQLLTTLIGKVCVYIFSTHDL